MILSKSDVFISVSPNDLGVSFSSSFAIAIAKELEKDTPKSFGETEMKTSDLDRIIHLAGINEGKKDKKVALPSGKEIKKCHDDGMSKAAIMKKYKDCDKEKLEKLYDAHCMGK